MRTLFIAVGRVFGLIQAYYGLAYVTSIIPALYMMQQASGDTAGEVGTRSFSGNTVILTTGSMIATLLLTFGVAWLLLFRTEWLANKLKIPEQNAQSSLTGETIFCVGARLLGIFVIIQAVPDLVGRLGSTISEIQQFAGVLDSFDQGFFGRTVFSTLWSSLVSPALKVAMGLMLTLKTDSVLDWMSRKKK
jgi:hypothetical protein